MKKNNKGFSLVELIVVVLIMGILAVALAPQVMKWVSKAGTHQDLSDAASIKEAVQVACADAAFDGTIDADFTWDAIGVNGIKENGTAPTALINAIKEVSGEDYKTRNPHTVYISGGVVSVN